jgi:hypothetical protein
MSKHNRERRKARRDGKRRPAEGLPNHIGELIAKGLPLSPGLHHVTVRHDEWCDLLAGLGPCNCNPDVGDPIRHDDWMSRN